MALIQNKITYTTYNAYYDARIENTRYLARPYRLTELGAERIIRREFRDTNEPGPDPNDVCVIHIEYQIEAPQ